MKIFCFQYICFWWGGDYIGFGNQEQLDAGWVLLRGVGGIRVDGWTEDTGQPYSELSGGFSNQEAVSFLCTAAEYIGH